GRSGVPQDLGRAAAARHRIRLRRAQRQGSAQLCNYFTCPGVNLRTLPRVFPGVAARAEKVYEKSMGQDGGKGETAGAAKWYELFSRGARDQLVRSEEHTSELQSQSNLVCRLLLEKKKKNTQTVRRRAKSVCLQRDTIRLLELRS